MFADAFIQEFLLTLLSKTYLHSVPGSPEAGMEDESPKPLLDPNDPVNV